MIFNNILAIATTAVFLLSLPSVSFAEKSVDVDQLPASISFACIAWHELPYEEMFYHESGEFYPLKLYPGRCSKLYSLKGGDSLELHIRKENDAGDLIYELVGLASLIKGTDQMLFIIERGGDSGSRPLMLRGLDDSWETFPVGAFRFVNFTPDSLQVTFGEETVELPSGLFVVVKSQVPENGGLVSFDLKDAEGVLVHQNRMLGQPTARQTVVIYPAAKVGRDLSLKFLSQRPPVDTSSVPKDDSTFFVVQSAPLDADFRP